MKKNMLILNLCFFTVFFSTKTLADYQTCPTVKEIYVKNGSRYTPVSPPGWQLINRINRINAPDTLAFGIAAWGNHININDHVRCYYYSVPLDMDNQVGIETVNQLHMGAIISHPGWSNSPDYYSFCNDYNNHNVNTCTFG